MTPTLSHQVRWFRHGSIVLPHVWEEKRVCPLVENPPFLNKKISTKCDLQLCCNWIFFKF
jgi:hypothetical protein